MNKIIGTNNKPRISVFRSNCSICGQAIDDSIGKTIASAGSQKIAKGTLVEKAKNAGNDLGKKLLTKKISEAVYDRNGYRYHGAVAAFADGLRESGIKF